MKKKLIITIASISLNLVLFCALAYCNKINSHIEGVYAPLFHLKHLSDIGYLPGDNHGIALASAVK